MEDNEATFVFVLGYITAFAVMYLTDQLSKLIQGVLENRQAAFVVSSNGTVEDKRDEEVARESIALAKEYTEAKEIE